MIININTQASVKLTEFGMLILIATYDAQYAGNVHPGWDRGMPIKMPLWELMRVFGPALHMEIMQVPFERNEIDLEAA